MARASESDVIYAAAVRHQSKLKPEDALKLFKIDLTKNSVQVQQAAIKGIASLKSPEAIALLDQLMSQLLDGSLNSSLTLELVEVAASSKSAIIRQKLKIYHESLPIDDSLAAYRLTRKGGNESQGQTLFQERQDFGCMRCHALGKQCGKVGPGLRDSSKPLTREQILESIVYPNRQIAEGYDAVMVDLIDGESISGVLHEENTHHLVVLSADSKRHEISKDQIESRQSTLSLMPEGLGEIMTHRELRDIIEFLSQP